jgi:hypothetical protein
MIETKLNNNKTIFFQRGSFQELIVINYDHNEKLADISIYETKNSYKHRLSLLYRLLCTIRCFYKGCNYHDQIVLNHKQLLELQRFLASIDL